MPYHVRITTKSNPSHDEVKLDLTKPQLTKRFVEPYCRGRPIVSGGKTITTDDIERIQISFTEQLSEMLLPLIRKERQASIVQTLIPDEWYVAENGKDVTDDFITGPAGTATPSADSTTPPATVDPRYVLVIHGRDAKARTALFQFLRLINLHPIEWSEARKATGEPSPHITAILEKAFSMAKAVVVLMTGDDEARLRPSLYAKKDPKYETTLTPQPRQNVLFEAGMAMGLHPSRTVLVQLGPMRPFSDISGLHLVILNNSSETRQELASRLQDCGCLVNLTGTDWHKAGAFTVKETRTNRPLTTTTPDRHATAGAGERDLQEKDARQTRHKPQAPYAPQAYDTRVYPAYLEPMLRQGGDLVDDADATSGRVWHVPPYGQSSPNLYGPYKTLRVGNYRVVFWMKMNPDPARPGQGRISCDIAYSKGDSFKVLKEEPNVKPPPPGRYEQRSLIFDVREEMKDARFEFRVFQREPGIELWVDKITITRL
ncbi:MAG TPA: nucleotide-binding protein [Armatimonadota bacterium]|nr:nucleotide-binding protein [Armatimonadota bacterium]